MGECIAGKRVAGSVDLAEFDVVEPDGSSCRVRRMLRHGKAVVQLDEKGRGTFAYQKLLSHRLPVCAGRKAREIKIERDRGGGFVGCIG